ncbi:MAG: hypothetical protein N0C84_01135 [Candidatus Thiodiazotropha taylori]|uniref:Uncharacterized protein n=1 Tax=Candidatus Thiodiazotropha taylori TaxID=2792791 RepID=A0A9E4KA86_9GAMM|nr:hypothetical protein [Candidatus Thiodiazotropha taylori]MCW4255050.1 hypothetical protein [Candidatus Thiodiazotropha taylori]
MTILSKAIHSAREEGILSYDSEGTMVASQIYQTEDKVYFNSDSEKFYQLSSKGDYLDPGYNPTKSDYTELKLRLSTGQDKIPDWDSETPYSGNDIITWQGDVYRVGVDIPAARVPLKDSPDSDSDYSLMSGKIKQTRDIYWDDEFSYDTDSEDYHLHNKVFEDIVGVNGSAGLLYSSLQDNNLGNNPSVTTSPLANYENKIVKMGSGNEFRTSYTWDETTFLVTKKTERYFVLGTIIEELLGTFETKFRVSNTDWWNEYVGATQEKFLDQRLNSELIDNKVVMVDDSDTAPLRSTVPLLDEYGNVPKFEDMFKSGSKDDILTVNNFIFENAIFGLVPSDVPGQTVKFGFWDDHGIVTPLPIKE